MEAQTYYESLVAQGYSAEQAQQHTAQHYPGFGAEPAPTPVAQQPQMMTGAVGVAIQPQMAATESNTTSKGMRITNGIFGILMSLAMLGYSLWVIQLWGSVAEGLEEEYQELGYSKGDSTEVDSFLDTIDSFISTLEILYGIMALVAVVVLVISIIQFLNKPWATKALLASTGLLLVLFLASAAYEISEIHNIAEEGEELTGDDTMGDELEDFTIFQVNGMIGAYCAGPCFLLFSLLAFIGRPKGEPVTMQPNQMM